MLLRPVVVALLKQQRGKLDVAERGEVGHPRGLGYLDCLAREALRAGGVRLRVR